MAPSVWHHHDVSPEWQYLFDSAIMMVPWGWEDSMGMKCSFSHNDGNLGMRTQHEDEMVALVCLVRRMNWLTDWWTDWMFTVMSVGNILFILGVQTDPMFIYSESLKTNRQQKISIFLSIDLFVRTKSWIWMPTAKSILVIMLFICLMNEITA